MVRWLLLLVAMPAIAAEPVALRCARGPDGYPDAAMILNERGAHVVNVTFVGLRPTHARADWSLRDCLRTAAKLDPTHDIDARLWYRERGPDSDPEPLERLKYKAASGRVVQP